MGNSNQPVVVKIRGYRGFGKLILHRFYIGPLQRAWAASRALDVRRIPNPRAIALMEKRFMGFTLRSVLVTERDPRAVRTIWI